MHERHGGETDTQTERQLDMLSTATAHEGTVIRPFNFVRVCVRCPCPAFPYTRMYVYHLPRICRTLVPEIRVCPEMLRVFRYIDVLTCVNYNCTKQG